MKKSFSENKFVYNYKYLGADIRNYFILPDYSKFQLDISINVEM